MKINLEEKLGKLNRDNLCMVITDYNGVEESVYNIKYVYIEDLEEGKENKDSRNSKILNCLLDVYNNGLELVNSKIEELIRNREIEVETEIDEDGNLCVLIIRDWTGIDFYTGSGYAKLLEYEFDLNSTERCIEVNLEYVKKGELRNVSRVVKTDVDIEALLEMSNEEFDNYEFINQEDLLELFKDTYNTY